MNPNILTDLITTLSSMDSVIYESGVYTEGDLPDEYIVLVPTVDTYNCADDSYIEAEEHARIYIYVRAAGASSIYTLKDAVVKKLMTDSEHWYTLSNSNYSGYNADTDYHVWQIDAVGTYIINSEQEE